MAASTRSRTPPASTRFDAAEALALQACDDTDSLREVLCAYTCLEKLIAPLEVGDTEQLGPTRTELGSLVRLVNEEMSRRVEAADSATRAMRAALARPEAG
ncbi:hypothetical protein FHT32_001315 [Variovorax sp. SG517]|uniref:hypothetical protein n=1 Tax=Variovorax sp. SG517 TaxID=2587117 RepID=UPI00159DA33E|nr:hypothetical protein [Variovorax sp. SG517]NVM87676.1 hypothetical protein [Variovorax sp. SG517]